MTRRNLASQQGHQMLGILIEDQEATVQLEVAGLVDKDSLGVTLKHVLLLANGQKPLDITRYLCADQLETLAEELNWDFARNPDKAGIIMLLDNDPIMVTINGDYSEEEDGVMSVLLGDIYGEHVDVYFYCRNDELAVWDQMLADNKMYDDELARGDDGDYDRD
jgi:hypothetical protein